MPCGWGVPVKIPLPLIGEVDVGDVALIVAAAYAAWRTLEAVGFGSLRDVLEGVKELAVVAFVLWYGLGQAAGVFPSLDAASVDSTYRGVWREAYEVYVDVGQCIANIALSGPAAAYASLASAKLEPIRDAAAQTLQTSAMLRAVVQFLAEWGGAILAAGLFVFGGWSRPIGAAIIAMPLAYSAALALHAASPTTQALAENWYEDREWWPVQALGCDNQIIGDVNATSRTGKTYLEEMYRFSSTAWWVIIAAPMAAGAVYAALSRH